MVAACVLKIKVVGVQGSQVFSTLSDNIACSLPLQVSLVGSTPVITRLFLLLLSRIIDPDKPQFSDKRFTSSGIERNGRPNR
ncbi:hypothetical protein COCOBI_pt-2210 (chloroplast) [Coccomyxa sp. Obi]|nr:hypothetical protein COCOBI_pt-2210 [Coccomyxa sp. Obi]